MKLLDLCTSGEIRDPKSEELNHKDMMANPLLLNWLINVHYLEAQPGPQTGLLETLVQFACLSTRAHFLSCRRACACFTMFTHAQAISACMSSFCSR